MAAIAIWEMEDVDTCQNLRVGLFMETGSLRKWLGKNGLNKEGAVTQYDCQP